MHSATLPKGILENMTELDKKTYHYLSMPLQKTKLTLYFDACRSRFASPFLNVSVQRAKKQLDSAAHGEANINLSYCEQICSFFEQQYPKEFLEEVKKHDIQFARLEGLELEEAKRIYQLYKAL
jgi:hypothetical protein